MDLASYSVQLGLKVLFITFSLCKRPQILVGT
uniref:Uncharacterized protein n=1 Tax=Rhizophora mucronata TaxID=61149 RepID=A0A2P2R4N5_RHIMU